MSTRLFLGYGAGLLMLGLLDGLWLGYVARDFYRQGIGHLMAESFRIGPAAAFYLLFPLGVMIFAVQPALAEGSMARALLLGALFGFFCYATYDLSNFATLRDWPLRVALVDMAWGTLAGTLVALAAYFVAAKF